MSVLEPVLAFELFAEVDFFSNIYIAFGEFHIIFVTVLYRISSNV